MTLPLPLRNRLADLILDSLHDGDARQGLEALAGVCADPHALAGRDRPAAFPADLFEARGGGLVVKSGWREYASELGERAARAWRMLGARPLDPPDAPLRVALGAAADLFDAGLYFEMHDALEPYWMRAGGIDREALQGLIQTAVGFQHLANGNLGGASALLHDGCAKLLGRRLEGLDLEPFAREVERCLDHVLTLGPEAAVRFDWTSVPRFPRHGTPHPSPLPREEREPRIPLPHRGRGQGKGTEG
ncbi:MAG TPA: DUF309 domain-containing protein [Methylomirabilota bacterium]|nr:DUF309 domain-containing protein [Methylomirabilota bacterium]